MKIHKQEATFQPITIVLESQEEVDVFITALNIGCGPLFDGGSSSFVSKKRILKLKEKGVPLRIWENFIAALFSN